MDFSNEEVRERTVLKAELAGRVNAVEEFFNQCHGKNNGRFCKGKTAVGGYISEKASATKETLEGRKGSENVRNVTVGFGKNVGSVRLNKLGKSNLKTFSNNDLKTIKKQLKVDQTHFRILMNVGLATATFNIIHTGLVPTPLNVARLANSATMIGVANYKINHIPAHLNRVNKELRSRGELSSLGIETFAKNLSVQDEIDKAMKELKSGNPAKITARPSTSQIAELEKFINALEPDSEEGITKKMISAVKSGLNDYKKLIK